MADGNTTNNPAIAAGYNDYRADLHHYWSRLMWYREELWRVTTPVWGVYGAFIAACIGFVWSTEKGQIAGATALMLIVVILSFSWVILRMYWTYAHRIYAAITYLNEEVRQREQYLYNKFLGNDLKSDYGRFRVYPELNVLFSIVGVTMMFACIFSVSASVGFNFDFQPETTTVGKRLAPSPFALIWTVVACITLVGVFEWVLVKNAKRCMACDSLKTKIGAH